MKSRQADIAHIKGAIDLEGRCKHYYGENDIISIKFACCDQYYPCYKCHEDNESHEIQTWDPKEFNRKAILCGGCKQELSITYYLSHDSCSNCGSTFNPNCSKHYHKYFNVENGSNHCS